MSQSFEEKRIMAAERLGITSDGIPRHIAIIMDGNGRWAQQQGKPRFMGHREGGKIVEDVMQYCVDIGVECMTLYSFSLQNWKRPVEEIEFLMHLYAMYLEGIRPILAKNRVRLVHLGQRERLPKTVLDALDGTLEFTKDNDGMVLALALNYGSRTEIVDAVKKIAEDVKNGKTNIDDIDEELFESNLYTAGLRDPDLLIRTSGEQRISNYLLWQISYSEFYITDAMWPDFDSNEVDKAILAYANRARRFGDVKANK